MYEKLLIATSNIGKLREYKGLLKDLPFTVQSLYDLNINNSMEEKYYTYAENALYKALYYLNLSGIITIADDSGLEVEALNGEPGVLSARYAGKEADDKKRIEYLLSKMKYVPWEERRAVFRCVIAICMPDGKSGIFNGECRGYIMLEPRGSNGFGYDPIFYIPELNMTMAELSFEDKLRVSHRARAFVAAKKMLDSIINQA